MAQQNSRRVPKHVTLPVDVCDRLEEEENQSQTVEAALREFFDEI